MTPSHRCSLLALALLTLAPFAGCASQAEIDRVNEANRALMDENARLARERDEARTGLGAFQNGTISKEQAVIELQKRLQEALAAREAAENDLRGLKDRFAKVEFSPVDADTDRALRELADQYPDLISYDSTTGMLRVASDLTFDSGRADVKPGAKPALQALARILTSGAAQQYDVIVEGHTDAQKVSANTAREHRTNRHLSAHRAISVLDELRGLGIAPDKMLAAGWGEFRPFVANTSTGNTPQNRRVEIFLVKSRGTFNRTNTGSTTTGSTGPDIVK